MSSPPTPSSPPPTYIEVELRQDVKNHESLYITSLDKLALHYLYSTPFSPTLAEPLWRKILALQKLNGEEQLAEYLYHLAVALNCQKKVEYFKEARSILEGLVPREGLDEDKEKEVLKQEVAAMRELLKAMEGCGMVSDEDKEDLNRVARKAVKHVMRLGEYREKSVMRLCQVSKTFREWWKIEEEMGRGQVEERRADGQGERREEEI